MKTHKYMASERLCLIAVHSISLVNSKVKYVISAECETLMQDP